MKKYLLLLVTLVLTACSHASYRGQVSEYRMVRSGMIYDLDGYYPEQKMTLFIPRGVVAKWHDVHPLFPKSGDTVEVSGPVTAYRGRPEIVINDPAQLRY